MGAKRMLINTLFFTPFHNKSAHLIKPFHQSFAITMADISSCPRATDSVDAEPIRVPVIDLGQLGHSMSRALVIREIGSACQKLGCFQVVNHGIQSFVIKDALEAVAGFFELPSVVKEQFASEDIRKPVRYGEGFMGDNCKDRAFLKLYAHQLSQWIHSWPLIPVDYRERLGKYAMEVRRVALQLIDAILESLGLGKAYMKHKLDEGMQIIATNSYSKTSQFNRQVGLATHTDYGFITILIENCEGLQIFKDIDGNGESWKGVPVGVAHTLHIQIGDHLEVLSNGRYRSLVHRAVLNTKQRISIASIHGLPMDEKVTIPKELVDEKHPKKYQESSFSDFLEYICTKGANGGKKYIDNLRIISS